MWCQRVWMEHANNAQISIVDLGSGWVVDACAFGSPPDKKRADGREGCGLIWVEAAGVKLGAWI